RAGAMGARHRAGCVIWEIFRRERKGQPFEHAGSVDAPDAEFAEAWAREQYGRRGESSALWLVPRDAVHVVDGWADEFDLKYRRGAGRAAKINREEPYHRMHAEMWHERLRDAPQFVAAVDELWPYALGMVPADQREALASRVGRMQVDPVERGTHTGELAELW